GQPAWGTDVSNWTGTSAAALWRHPGAGNSRAAPVWIRAAIVASDSGDGAVYGIAGRWFAGSGLRGFAEGTGDHGGSEQCERGGVTGDRPGESDRSEG